MSKALKIVLWVVGILLVLVLLFFFVVGPKLKSSTKKHSPEVTETYTTDDLEIEVFYCSPSKKDRVIFGELIPYGEVWRTGANEASTFETNKDLNIDGKTLPAGKYSLWTIPDADSWQIIFNSKMYGWGVRWQDSKAMRESEYDVLVTTATVANSINSTENFTIKIIEGTPPSLVMLFSWDTVVVPVPMSLN